MKLRERIEELDATLGELRREPRRERDETQSRVASLMARRAELETLIDASERKMSDLRTSSAAMEAELNMGCASTVVLGVSVTVTVAMVWLS